MAIQFPADPAAQTPVNTLSPTSTPVANTENDLTFVWNGTVWNAVTGGSGAVDSIIAGVGIAVDQPTGDVTITNTGGGGTVINYNGVDAWALGSGSGDLTAGGFNVQDINRSSQGVYEVTFITPMPQKPYTVNITANGTALIPQVIVYETTGFIFGISNPSGNATDSDFQFAVFAENAIAPQSGVGADAWGVVNGDASLLNGYNVTSSFNSDPGSYQITFNSAMPNDLYSVVANVNAGASLLVAVITGQTTNGFIVRVLNNAGSPINASFNFTVFASSTVTPTYTWTRDGTTLSPANSGDDVDVNGSITNNGVYINTRFATSGSVNTYINLDDGTKYGLAIRDLESKILIGLNANGKIRTTGGIESPITAGNYAYALGAFATASGGLFLESDASGSLYLSPGSGAAATVDIKGADGNITTTGRFKSTPAIGTGVGVSVDYTDVNYTSYIGIRTNAANYAFANYDENSAKLTFGVDLDGTILAGNLVTSTSTSAGVTNYYSGNVYVNNSSGAAYLWLGRNGSTTTSWIQGNGNYYFAGTGSFSNAFIALDPDNAANYVSTTNADGETESVYSGPQLDVKALLLEFQAKIETLEAAKAALEARITTLEGSSN